MIEKSIISGHYIFSNEEFIDLKKEVSQNLKNKTGIDLDIYLKDR